MTKYSYCAIHDTYPREDEPCWQCYNKAFFEGIKEAHREELDTRVKNTIPKICFFYDHSRYRPNKEELYNCIEATLKGLYGPEVVEIYRKDWQQVADEFAKERDYA